MNDTEWFLEEFGPIGFTLGPTTYDPTSFSPTKSVIFNHPNGVQVLTRMKFTPELANDLHAWGHTFDDLVEEFRMLFRQEINRFLEQNDLLWLLDKPKDFIPIKKLNKFNL